MSKQISTNSEMPPISENVTMKEKDILCDVKMSFERFPIPNYVRVKALGPFTSPSSMARVPGLNLDAIPEDVLRSLVDAFIAEVYAKAGKENPYTEPYKECPHCPHDGIILAYDYPDVKYGTAVVPVGMPLVGAEGNVTWTEQQDPKSWNPMSLVTG